jgi:hypothetical protein
VVGRKTTGWVDDESSAERVTQISNWERGLVHATVETFMHANNASIGRFEFLFLPRSQSGGVKPWNAGE